METRRKPAASSQGREVWLRPRRLPPQFQRAHRLRLCRSTRAPSIQPMASHAVGRATARASAQVMPQPPRGTESHAWAARSRPWAGRRSSGRRRARPRRRRARPGRSSRWGAGPQRRVQVGEQAGAARLGEQQLAQGGRVHRGRGRAVGREAAVRHLVRQPPAGDPLPADGHRLGPPPVDAVLVADPGGDRGVALLVAGPGVDQPASFVPATAGVVADDVVGVPGSDRQPSASRATRGPLCLPGPASLASRRRR